MIKEKKHARSTLRQYDENKSPKFDYWRTASVASIQYEAVEQEEFEEELFFKSKAARDAFHAYRSHEHEHKVKGDSDAIILSLVG